jgi:3-dehydroquinate synthase
MPDYDIIIGHQEMDKIESYVKEFYDFKEVYILTDDHVFSLYKEKINDWFNAFDIKIVVIPFGETSKSYPIYLNAINDLIKQGIKRQHLLIALGGGVVGDLAGFIASTLYRGIPFMQIPTSLLAMVDSSIGGKVGIDLELGKNLIGSFYQPKKVIIDPNFLNTLPLEEYQNGMAEMIKSGLIGDKDLYTYFINHQTVTEKEIIQTIQVKRRVVLIDPFDKKERMFLNFGHSYGHAIEKKTKYEIYKHGQAISYGMLIALQKGISLNVTPKYLYDEVKQILLKNSLVKEPLLKAIDFEDELKYDKKNMADGYHFILIENVGKAVIKKIKLG